MTKAQDSQTKASTSLCPTKRCLLVTFQVAGSFATDANWEDQEVHRWVLVLFLDRKSLLIFPNEPHLFPIATSKCYQCSILVLPSYEKNVHIIIVAISLFYSRLNLVLLLIKLAGFSCYRVWILITFLLLANYKPVILPFLVSILSSTNWKNIYYLSHRAFKSHIEVLYKFKSVIRDATIIFGSVHSRNLESFKKDSVSSVWK